MNLNNYRVTFGGTVINYKSNFIDCRVYWKHVEVILGILQLHGVSDRKKWWFFEPYAEITWIEDNKQSAKIQMDGIKTYLQSQPGITDVNYLTPENGMFADWYFQPGNEEERDFSYTRYAACAIQSQLFYEYMDAIESDEVDCKGFEKHYARSCHVLANQLGFSYKDEGRLLFWRAVLCKLFWIFGHHKAVWIYTKIFRQKY